MATIRVTIDDKPAREALKKYGPQASGAVVKAINDAMFITRSELQKQMVSSFDRPTPYTQRSLAVRKATDANPYAQLDFRGASKQNNRPDKFLPPGVFGGGRGLKGFERRLIQAGVMPKGMYAVPARGAKLDAFGNMRGSDLTRILSRVNALGEASVGGKTTRRLGKRKLLVGRGRTQSAKGFTSARVLLSDHFVARSTKDGQPLGIYRLVGRGNVEPVLYFTRTPPTYQARYPFFEVGQAELSRLVTKMLLKRLGEVGLR